MYEEIRSTCYCCIMRGNENDLTQKGKKNKTRRRGNLNNALPLHLGAAWICSASASWARWLLLRAACRRPAEPATTKGRTGGPSRRAVEGRRRLCRASPSSLGSRSRVQAHATGGGRPRRRRCAPAPLGASSHTCLHRQRREGVVEDCLREKRERT